MEAGFLRFRFSAAGQELARLGDFERPCFFRPGDLARDPLILPIIVLFAIGLLGQWRLVVLQRAWKEGISPHDQLLNLFEVARQSFEEQPFARHYRLVKAVLTQRKIRPARTWESLSVLLFMFIIWGGVGARLRVWQRSGRLL